MPAASPFDDVESCSAPSETGAQWMNVFPLWGKTRQLRFHSLEVWQVWLRELYRGGSHSHTTMYVSSYYNKCVLKLSRQIVKGWLIGLFIGTQTSRAHPSPASYRENTSWHWVTFPQALGGEKRAFHVLIIYHLRLNPLATNLPYMTEMTS